MLGDQPLLMEEMIQGIKRQGPVQYPNSIVENFQLPNGQGLGEQEHYLGMSGWKYLAHTPS